MEQTRDTDGPDGDDVVSPVNDFKTDGGPLANSPMRYIIQAQPPDIHGAPSKRPGSGK